MLRLGLKRESTLEVLPAPPDSAHAGHHPGRDHLRLLCQDVDDLGCARVPVPAQQQLCGDHTRAGNVHREVMLSPQLRIQAVLQATEAISALTYQISTPAHVLTRLRLTRCSCAHPYAASSEFCV